MIIYVTSYYSKRKMYFTKDIMELQTKSQKYATMNVMIWNSKEMYTCNVLGILYPLE